MDKLMLARLIHAMWVCFQMGAGQDYNAEPDEEDIRSNIASLEDYLQHPDRTPEQSHELWMADRIANGWKFGPVKDKVKKTHPDLVPYDLLPEVEKLKDTQHLFALQAAMALLGGAPKAVDPIRSGGKDPFEYQKPNSDQVERIEMVRKALKQSHECIMGNCKPSRERSLAITKLEETSMWANKSIVFEAKE
jgi:hypothetical protein